MKTLFHKKRHKDTNLFSNLQVLHAFFSKKIHLFTNFAQNRVFQKAENCAILQAMIRKKKPSRKKETTGTKKKKPPQG